MSWWDLDQISRDINRVTRIAAPPTPEDEEKARRAICGSEFCKDAEDASIMLQALGLIPYSEVANAEVSGN